MTKSRAAWDWRVILGAILTGIWISAGLLYLLGKVGWGNFVDLPTGDIGSFLEGAFAPLAFLWLVIGHFLQQSEISTNTKAILLQEQSAQRQEVHAQRNSYFKLLGLVQEQLNAIAGFHYMSVCGPTGSGEMSNEEFNDLRAESRSDQGAFIRKMISLSAQNRNDPKATNEVFFGTEIRARHSKNYADTFSKLLAAAEAIDHDDMLVNALLFGSAAGIYYRIVRHVQGEEKMNPISGITTQQKR